MDHTRASSFDHDSQVVARAAADKTSGSAVGEIFTGTSSSSSGFGTTSLLRREPDASTP